MNAGFVRRTRRYVVVGALCALCNNAVLIGGAALGIHYFPLTILSFLLVTPLGYALQCGYTFSEPFTPAGLLRFAAGVAATYPMALGMMVLFCSILGWPMAVAAPVATIILFAWNYVSAHWAILGRLRFR